MRDRLDDRRLRVTMVAPDYPPNAGGIAAYCAGLAGGLARAGHLVTVLAPPPPVGLLPEAANTPRVLRRTWLAPDTGGAGWIRRFRYVARRLAGARHDPALRNADLVLVMGLSWYLALAVSTGVRRYSQVLFGETYRYLRRQKTRPDRWRRFLYRRTVRKAERIYAISDYLADLIRQASGRREGIRLLYAGVDIKLLDGQPEPAAARTRFGLGTGPLVLSLGRLVPRKGFDMALEAVALLRDDFPGLTFVVGGSGPDEDRLREMTSRLGIQQTVRFVGYVPQEDLLMWYAACDVFTMPSREDDDVEGFGIVYLEANAAGKPVVAGRSGGVPDAVADGENGLLVAPESPDEIASAIRALLRDPERRRRMGENGRERIRLRFNWDSVARRLVEFHCEGSIR